MRPYWMDSAVMNRVALDCGDTVLLTAPNGGGKTTLLRAAASCVLLHQCGLAVPCKKAVIPNVDGLFLRCGSLDATLERRSSFGNEMIDLRTMINTPGIVIAFVDEPCRGTSSTEGLALLRAVLENLPPTMTVVVSTHYHELTIESQRAHHWQLDAEVVEDDCRPRFKLSNGVCRNSLALHVALAVGLPIDIVKRARRSEDVETLLLANLYANQVQFERVGPLQSVGATLSTLYVLDTVDGVYVGESDHMVQRLQQHERVKPTIRCFFVARCTDKTHARRLESMLIADLKFHNVVLLSVTDARECV
jgi:DNA mismatch repair ATPase MutS